MTEYEIHVTVEEHPTVRQARELNKLLNPMGAKAILIGLPLSAKHPTQLIVCKRVNYETDGEAAFEAGILHGRLAKAGWNVLRTKLEAQFGTEGQTIYNEAHYVFLTYTKQEEQLAREFNLKYPDLKYSKSLTTQGKHYFTLRLKPDNIATTRALFNDYNDKMDIEGKVLIERVHTERVIIDTNISMDDGWAEL